MTLSSTTRAQVDGSAYTDIQVLWRDRPRSRLLRLSAILIGLLVLAAWWLSDIDFRDLFSARRMGNLDRFIHTRALPPSLRADADPSDPSLWAWCVQQMAEYGWRGLGSTLCISVVAITLASGNGALLGAFGARNLMSAHPFVPHATAGHGDCSHALDRVAQVVRVFCILLRAIPEYIWAYLFLAMLGPTAWPAILALAIHNSGILGRLGGETIENLPSEPLRAMSMAGATRKEVAVAGIFPMALGRYLLYFFYRFETCVREATVLGMLGIVSLGYFIHEARAHDQYDEMIFLVILGGVLVMMADVVSDLARRWLRRGV
ncbi:MAG: PhnE/PtxC family ABC transporter permease [Planctomycetota bacterium]|jgi:phosphonate transport system permease protein